MTALLRKLPQIDVAAWTARHRAKIAGLLAGTLGTTVLTLFLVVAITGVPHGRTPPTPEPVYIID